MADSSGFHLDKDFFWLNFVELDFLKLELAVEFGNDKGGGCAGRGHLCYYCDVWGIFEVCVRMLLLWGKERMSLYR